MMGAFEQVIELSRRDIGSPEFERWHANVARAGLAEHLSLRGDDPEVMTIVDGRVGASEDSVRLHGIIRYELNRTSAAIPDLLRWLQAEAAKVSPKYARSFFVGVLEERNHTRARGRGKKHWTTYGAEGRVIPADQFAAGSRGLPADASFVIGNSVPWNRMVDVQMIGHERMRFSIPDGIYDRAALWLRSRFPEWSARRIWNLSFEGNPGTGESRWILKNGPRRGSPVQSPGLIVWRD